MFDDEVQWMPARLGFEPFDGLHQRSVALPKYYDCSDLGKQADRRMRISDRTRAVLRSWYQQNYMNPYPSREEKFELARLSGATFQQVSVWLRNARANAVRSLRRTDLDVIEAAAWLLELRHGDATDSE
jgi:hypothetical protein